MSHRGEESGVGSHTLNGSACFKNAQPSQALHGVYPEPAEGFRETCAALFIHQGAAGTSTDDPDLQRTALDIETRVQQRFCCSENR